MTTHALKHSTQAIVADTTGYAVTTNCNAVIYDNNGDDDAQLYFNNDNANFYLLKAGEALPVTSEKENEQITDIVKIVFATTASPRVDILKQTKTLIT